jgi:hypothetical protein
MPTVAESDDAEAAKHTTPPAPLLKTLVSSISRADRQSVAVASTAVSPGIGIGPTS